MSLEEKIRIKEETTDQFSSNVRASKFQPKLCPMSHDIEPDEK